MSNDKNLKALVGRTIRKASYRCVKDCDDAPFIDLEFTDNTKTTITAYYGEFTGESEYEYPSFIMVDQMELI